MNRQIKQIVAILDMLPEKEQNFALKMVKRIFLTWDKDYTKLTPKESADLAESADSGYFWESDVDWRRLDKYK
ncbi:MAG: hypothetical protein K2J08_07640 [Ruminococcus sp.]|nr:hypothetical protein [Ruminococcus sp.]